MSTLGVRLGLAAMSALSVGKADQFAIEGVYRARNCAIDGIQLVTACTTGNGNLLIEDASKAEFTLLFRDNSRTVTFSISPGALARFTAHKEKKARLLDERGIGGLAKAMDIDAELKRDFDSLILWVQEASEDEVVHKVSQEGF
jgi:formylmethanofuran dehydrogenase subunit E